MSRGQALLFGRRFGVVVIERQRELAARTSADGIEHGGHGTLLAEEPIDTGIDRQALQPRVGVSGNHDRRQGWISELESPDAVDAVNIRQLPVDHHHVNGLVRHNIQRRRHGGNDAHHRDIDYALDRHAQCLGERPVIIDE